MATPTIRQVVTASAVGAAATANTGAGTAVDDVLVCFAGNDWYTAGAFTTPTGTAGTWTLQATGDAGSNAPHLKVWTRPVTAGGANTVTVTDAVDEEVCNTTVVLTGADTTTPNDGTPAGSNGAASASQVAPAVSPTTADALLLCGTQSGSTTSSTFTPPSGMTERSDITAAASTTSQSTASVVLSASGATGTKTFTSTASAPYASASIAIRGSGGGGGPTAIPGRSLPYTSRRRAVNW